MKFKLLSTKLYIPPTRSTLVVRDRLHDLLFRGMNNKLTLVSAPAGFGKTTLISEWVTSCDQTPVWLSLDRNDNELNRFLSYLIITLQKIAPFIGEGIIDSLESPQSFTIQTLLVDLINDITQVSEHFILVLDDYHHITNDEVHSTVNFLLENLPSQMHIVISTRSDPPWPMARLRARGEMNEIRTRDLRFTKYESDKFLLNVMGLQLTNRDLEEIDSKTEGWIAGLQMAALSMRNRDDVSGYIRSFSQNHRFILDYLVEEVLSQQSVEVQDFLLKTSILERLTEPLCDQLTGGDSDTDMLLDLDQSNLFLVPLDYDRQWYRYHHLFSELLRGKLAQTYPDEISTLHRKASNWYEAHGYSEDAIFHAFEAGDLQIAADLIELFAMDAINESKIRTLSDWIEKLPQDLIYEKPMLCVYLAWTRYWKGDREHVEECLNIAEAKLNAAVDAGGRENQNIVGYIAVMRAFCAIQAEDPDLIYQMSKAAINQLPEGNYMRALGYLALASAYWGMGRVELSEEYYRQTVSMAKRGGYRNLVISGSVYVGMQQSKKGRLVEAMDTYKEALKISSRSPGVQLPFACFPTVKIGDIYREWNDLESAKKYIHNGMLRSVQLGHPDVLAEAYLASTKLELAQKEFSRANENLSKLVKLSESAKLDPWIGAAINECLLSMWVARGEIEKISEWTDQSGLKSSDNLSYLDDLNHINLAWAFLAQGNANSDLNRLADAESLLSRLHESAQAAGWIKEVIRIKVLLAITFQVTNKKQLAVDTMISTLKLAEPGRYVRIFIDHGRSIEGILKSVVTQTNRYQYAVTILNTLKEETQLTYSSTPPISRDAQKSLLVEPLSNREQQILRLLTTELTVPEIAEELVIGVSTVRSHIKSIYGKLDVHSRYKAVAKARELGLV